MNIGYKMLPRSVDAWIDLENGDFLGNNPELSEKITVAPDGTPNVIRWKCDESFPTIKLGRRVSMADHSHFCFKIYSEKATGTTVMLRLNLVADNDRYIQGGVCGKKITLDFEGWKEFRILRDHLTVAYPPPFFDSASLISSGYALDGCIPENVIYITSVTAERENLEVIAPEGTDINDSELYEAILRKREEITVGNPDVWDMPHYLDKVRKGEEACEKAWAQFKETWCEGEKGKLFNLDIQRVPWVDEPKIQQLYAPLLTMATAYARPRSKFHKNPELLEDIKKGLEYAYKNYYGENLFTTTTFGNWWPWWVGIPQYGLIPILILLRHELGLEAVRKYCSVIEFLMPFPYGSGCNMMDMASTVMLSGALTHDAKRICVGKSFVMKDLDYFDDTCGGDGGFYPDGSFIQHSNHPYHRGYGIGLLRSLVNIMNFMQGTAFEFTEDCVNNQYKWMFENFRHQIFYKYFSAGTAGRGVTRGEAEAGAFKDLICEYIKMRSYAPDEWKGKFDSLIRRLMLNTGRDYSDFHAMWPNLAKYCIDLYSDDSVTPDPDYLTTRVFRRMARVAHHNRDYGAALIMSSDTIHKYESINGENKQGWYFGDGFLMLYDYKGYTNHGGEFFSYGSSYLRPAVTINTAERVTKCIFPSIPNGSPYAGGVECGKYGSAGFVLKYDPSVMYYGTHKDIKDTKITANKSWFFFDNEIVCLGSGIKDASGTPVITCVDNRLWSEGDTLTVGKKEITPTEKTEISEKYAHFSGIGGYVFLDENKITVNKATRGHNFNENDEKKFDFLEIVIHHGVGNENLNGSYSYAYLPAQSAEETANYLTNPDIEIIKNTEKTHAVYEKKLGILAINFFDADTTEAQGYKIEAKTLCTLMIENGVLYVSDPTGRLNNVELTVNGKEYVIDTSEKHGNTIKLLIK